VINGNRVSADRYNRIRGDISSRNQRDREGCGSDSSLLEPSSALDRAGRSQVILALVKDLLYLRLKML
jgi:hypothetical protein